MMKCRISISATIFFLTMGWATSAFAENWPQWRGPDANGIAREALPESPAIDNIIWKRTIGEGYSSFAVMGDSLIASGHSKGEEFIFSLNPASAEVNWQFTYGAKQLPRLHKGGPSASPVISGVNIYVISKDGQMHCLTLAEGKPVWKLDLKTLGGISKPPEWGYSGSPLVNGNTVFVESGKTFALDKLTGKVIWQSQEYRPSYGTPALFSESGKERLAVLKTDGLVILDSENGKTLAFTKWETSFDTNSTTPITVGNEIFISTGYKRGCALFRFENKTLTTVYENKAMSNHMNNSVLVDGVLCGFDGNAHMGKPTEFVGIEWATGNEVFRVPKSEGLGCGSVIADKNGTLIILGEKGELILATGGKSGFEIQNREQILGGRCWTPTVLADGRVFARNAEGDLVAVDLKNK